MSAKTLHTPGPWCVDYSGPARIAIADHMGTEIAFCSLQGEDGDTDEANARLIAAAPELLRNLERLYEYAITHAPDFSEHSKDGETRLVMAGARSAIAKATTL